tara:strand:+ start:391 stop:1230 length:840 start_codon:yes stop_codon:yes gene_type:complete
MPIGDYSGGSTSSNSNSSSNSSSSSSSNGGSGVGRQDVESQYGAGSVGSYDSSQNQSGRNENTSGDNGGSGYSNDNRLNYLTGDYQDIKLNPEQKEQFQDYRENVEQAINPMAKTSNIAIGMGLNKLIPGAGYLFGHYKQSTAMGYGMTNPLNGLTDKFGNAKDWVADKFGGLLDGSTGNFNTSTVGQGDNDRTTMNTLAPLAPYAVSETTPDVSQANKWYNSIGENTESTFNFAQAYADAKTKVTNNLRSHGPLAQLAVSDSPYYDWLKVNKMDKGIL